jgi:hypothetical protein
MKGKDYLGVLRGGKRGISLISVGESELWRMVRRGDLPLVWFRRESVPHQICLSATYLIDHFIHHVISNSIRSRRIRSRICYAISLHDVASFEGRSR